MLRASGVELRSPQGGWIRHSIRRFEFRVPLGDHGDVYDRYMIRVLEMRESIEDSAAGARDNSGRPDHGSEGEDSRLSSRQAGEAYGRIEGPKGELGFYLISDGSPNPYRYRVRPPSFINLTILEDMCLGHTVADVVVILGSVDIVWGRWTDDCRRCQAQAY